MKNEFIVIAAHRSDGLTLSIGYLPEADKPYMLIMGATALRAYKTKTGVSRALRDLASFCGISESGFLYSRAGDECVTEKNVVLTFALPMRRATVKVF